MEDQTMISILGSGNLATSLPENLDDLFEQGILVNRNPVIAGHPHEMAGYSAYIAFTALELRSGCSYTAEKKRLLAAVLDRLKASNGFWQHSHLSEGSKDNHGLRATAAAIKLLLEAKKEGLFQDEALVLSLLKKHLSYHEKLTGGGIWFFHDSVEGSPKSKKIKLLRVGNAFGSSDFNALVLNTHVETLNLLMSGIESLSTKDDVLGNYLEQGVLALKRVLFEPRAQPFWFPFFEGVETSMRRTFLKNIQQKSPIFNKLYKLYFTKIRKQLHYRNASFQHSDGYLDRAIYYNTQTYNYHIVNVLDLARFLKKYDTTKGDFAWKEQLEKVILNGLDYAFSPAFLNYSKHLSRKNCTAIQLCEVIVIFWAKGELLEEKWVKNYLRIREILPPSPAILGYDPAIVHSIAQVDSVLKKTCLAPQIDLFLLENKEVLLINTSKKAFPIDLGEKFLIETLTKTTFRAEIPAKSALRLTPTQ